ncbi:MAG: hypothetical protein CMJ34_13355 [Phycisphaerae bacterium]|nr:hypothetical protein [Phycisphaerae bacterium]
MTLLDADLPTAAAIWSLWQRGVVDSRSPMRLPVVGTVGVDGLPELRTVVLRSAQLDTRQLVLHSDIRAAKVSAIKQRPSLAWHFWNPRHRLQLRASGPARLHLSGPILDTAWARLSDHQKRTYAATAPPASTLEEAGDGLPPLQQAESGRANFCVVAGTINHIDVLQLRRGGHRRCLLSWSEDRWSAQWVVP